jgi:hypothetical protein
MRRSWCRAENICREHNPDHVVAVALRGGSDVCRDYLAGEVVDDDDGTFGSHDCASLRDFRAFGIGAPGTNLGRLS